MIAVKYIGHRRTYREGAYGSGMEFTKGQTINVEDDALANKLLRHKDVYVRGDADESNPTAKVVAKPNAEDPQQELRDSVVNMNKESITTFAKTHFSTSLDQRKSVDTLRTQVIGLIDQFGIE